MNACLGGYVWPVGECEIGSEAWMRERIEQGLDPAEGDRPLDDHLLRIEALLAGAEAEPTGAFLALAYRDQGAGCAFTS